MRGYKKLLVPAFALLFGLNAAHGAEAPAITVRAAEHPDFDRIVFDWPHDTAFAVKQEDGHATVRFGAPAQVNFGEVPNLSRAHGFAAATDNDGNLNVSFAVGPKTALKSFTSGHSVVIDVVNAPATTAAAEPVKKPEPPAAKPELPPAVTVPVAATTPVPVVTPSATAPAQTSTPVTPPAMTPMPVASTPVGTTAAVSTPVATPAPAAATPAPAPTPAPEQMAAVVPPPAPPPPLSQTAPVPAPVPAPAAAPTPAPAVPAPTTGPATVGKGSTRAPSADTGASASPSINAKAAPGSSLTIGDTPVLVAALDPHTAIRAAVWARGGYGYIVFDRKLTLSLGELTASQALPLVNLEPLDLAKDSGFRFVIPDEVEIRATRTGSVWKIFLAKEQAEVPVSTALVAQPEFALGARFLLPLPDAPEPIKLTDPIIEDNLVLVPLEQTEAFSLARRMADFMILPAAQGLVIRPLNDKLVVRSVTDGIEITAEGGLHLSNSIDTGASQQSSQRAKAAATGKSMFDFAGWKGKPGETFTESRQRLQQTIVDVPERERNRARLELARFYFANGYGEEASAMLAMLAKQMPDLQAHADFLALWGASKILAYRPEDGLKDLATAGFTSQPEIDLWQAVAQSELRNWTEAEEKFAVTETLMVGYPEPFYTRFMVLAIESALAASKDREAADWLDRLETGPHNKNADVAIAYMHAVLYAKSGSAVSAEQAWKDVAASENRLYKVRAELALIDLGVANRSLTPAQAADRLEALRFGWRGDDLEVDILHRLGQFYVQAKNVKSGLNVLAQAVQLYPDSPMTPQIKDEMSKIFLDVYLGELGKALAPIDALTLYQQYRNLIPPGAEGIEVTRNLAERLVAIDLLQQAGDLLEDLVRNRLQGEEKGRIGARVAAIRLLDHQPQAAIAALDIGNNDTYPPDMMSERLLLRARAFSEMRKFDEALALIKDKSSPAAKALRADIDMRAQHWTQAAKDLIDLAGPPPKGEDKLSADQAQWILNAAIALSLAEDRDALSTLAEEYGDAMASSPQNDTFRVLTQPEKDVELKDIAAAQAKISDVDMFRGFLDNYRKMSAAPAGAAEAKPAETGKP